MNKHQGTEPDFTTFTGIVFDGKAKSSQDVSMGVDGSAFHRL